MNFNKLQQDILLTDYFRVDRPRMHFTGAAFLTELPADPEALDACMEEFLRMSLLSKIELWNKRDGFEVTPDGFRAAEDLRRNLGQRHPALVGQASHKLDDLLLALASDASIKAGQVLRPSTLGNGVGTDILHFYLNHFQPSVIDERVKQLVDAHLAYTAKRGHGESPYFCVSERGFKLYMTEARFRLGLGPEETILDEMPSDTAEIFLAFQTEYSKSRRIIDETLKGITDEINALPGLVRKLRVTMATEPGDGGVRIDLALLQKIKTSSFFVGDVTPVELSSNQKRIRINDCVLVELGYALAHKSVEDIVLPSMLRTKDEGFPGKDDAANPQFPFDIGHMRRIHFATKEDLKRLLRVELIAKLRRRRWLPA